MTEYAVEDALAEIGDLVRCRCHPAYKDRKMHDPDCHCDSVEAVSAVAAEVARLTAERDALWTALQLIADGYGPNHMSKYAHDTARSALDKLTSDQKTAV